MFSTLGVSILAIIYTLILSRLVSKKSSGSKKMADAAKIIADEAKTSGKKKYQNLALATIVLFTGLLYAFGWAVALTFLAGAIIFAASNYFSMIISNMTDVRMAEAAKTGVREAFSLGFNTATVGSLIILSPALLVITLVFLFAGSDLPLWSLALATIVTMIFSWQKNSSGFFAVFATALIVALVLAGRYFPDSQPAKVFPLAIFALGLLAAIIGSWFARVGKKTVNIFAVITKYLVLASVIFLTGSYFAVRYLLPSSGKYGILILFLLLAAGAIFAFGSLIFGRKLVILPAILLAALALLTNFFTGTYGIMLAVAGVAVIIPLAIALNLLFTAAKNAEIISQSAELPEETEKNLAIIVAARISSKNFTALSGAVAALAILLIFVDKFSASGLFELSNLKIIAGLLVGAALAYHFSSEVFADEMTPLTISVILPILAGLIFGPGFLAGLLAGIILINLLVKNINLKVLAIGVISVLIIQFIGNLYSLKVRLIILGAAIVVAALYLMIKKLYDGRKIASKRIAS